MTEWVYIGYGKKGHAIEGRITDGHGFTKCGIAGPVRYPYRPFVEYGGRGKCEKCKTRLEAEKK